MLLEMKTFRLNEEMKRKMKQSIIRQALVRPCSTLLQNIAVEIHIQLQKSQKFSNNGITVFIFVGNAHDIPQLDLSKVSAAIVEEDEASTTRSSLSE